MRLILASASPRRAELLRAAGFEFEIVSTDVDESVRPGESPRQYVRRLAAEKSAAAMAALKGCTTETTATETTTTQTTTGETTTANTTATETTTANTTAPSVVQAFRPADDAIVLGANTTTRRSVVQAFRPADDVIVLGADTTVVVGDEILAKPVDDADAAAMLRRLSGRRHDVLTGISLRRGAYELGRVESTSVEFARLTEADVAWYVASGEGRDKAGAYAIQGLASRFIPRIDGSYSNVVGLPVACVFELITEISGTRPDY